MPYVSPKQIEKAKEMDLLTYLENYEPSEFGVDEECYYAGYDFGYDKGYDEGIVATVKAILDGSKDTEQNEEKEIFNKIPTQPNRSRRI
ncbi:MAG: hypothetical protein R3Y35_12030 [Clostridia bacterium]